MGIVDDTGNLAVEQEVATGTFGAMVDRFDGNAGAFAYLLFILLYFPCTAVLAAVFRETNLRWAAFVAVAWIGGLLAVFSALIWMLRWWSNAQARRSDNGASSLADGGHA